MTEREIRGMLIESLMYASPVSLADEQVVEAFIAGRRDLTFAELALDSLAMMELCIAIEAHTGMAFAPEQLQQFRSLHELVVRIHR